MGGFIITQKGASLKPTTEIFQYNILIFPTVPHFGFVTPQTLILLYFVKPLYIWCNRNIIPIHSKWHQLKVFS